MPARCLIVDDAPAAHYVLEKYIADNPRLTVAGHCYNGYEAARFLSENEVDLMFLDIDMPEITGLELLQQLERPPKTILTTAYSEFALESYDYGVIDYLLKPIFFPRFEKSIARFLENFGADAAQPDHIKVKVDSDWIEIALDELYYAQSYGNYVKLFTPKKRGSRPSRPTSSSATCLRAGSCVYTNRTLSLWRTSRCTTATI